MLAGSVRSRVSAKDAANVFDRWWGVKFVFCQLGGFLPFTMGRFDQQFFFERRVYEQEKRPMPEYLQRRVVEYCQAFYVDTHTADASAMRCAHAGSCTQVSRPPGRSS